MQLLVGDCFYCFSVFLICWHLVSSCILHDFFIPFLFLFSPGQAAVCLRLGKSFYYSIVIYLMKGNNPKMLNKLYH